jgi:hypothetical protein
MKARALPLFKARLCDGWLLPRDCLLLHSRVEAIRATTIRVCSGHGRRRIV